MRKTVKRQRTILGIVLREIKRKLATTALECSASLHLNTLLGRAQRIHQQQPKDKNKLYVLHAPQVEIIHRGKYKSLTKPQRRWLKRRQAVEPAIGHLKSDHRMDRCWLQGKLGDALHIRLINLFLEKATLSLQSLRVYKTAPW